MLRDSHMLVVSVPAWRSFIQIHRRRSGHRRETFISTQNDKQPFSINQNPHLWPPALTLIHFLDRSRFDLLAQTWDDVKGHIAVNSALPLHLSRWYPAKAAGLFRQAPVPAESLILKFKPRVNFLFFYWLWDKLPASSISNSISSVTHYLFCAAFMAVLA